MQIRYAISKHSNLLILEKNIVKIHLQVTICRKGWLWFDHLNPKGQVIVHWDHLDLVPLRQVLPYHLDYCKPLWPLASRCVRPSNEHGDGTCGNLKG